MTQYSSLKDLENLSRVWVKKVVQDVGKTASLIGDRQLKDELVGVLDSLSQLDRNLEGDIKALELLQSANFQRAINAEAFDSQNDEGQESVKENFEKIRNEVMAVDNFSGRHDRAIGEARQQLEHTAQGGADDDDVPEMEMISITYSEKDPISKLPIKEPVKNSVCGHVYDRDSIASFIDHCKARRQLCQCPVRSCPNKQQLHMSRMVPFPEFFNHIQKTTANERRH